MNYSGAQVLEQDLGGDYSANRFVNQFVLGPVFIDSLTGWNHVSVNDALRLTVYPELQVEQVKDEEKTITIIGYILDPAYPAASNADVAKALMAKYGTLDQLIGATEGLGGRWLLIASDGEQTVLFNDAMGLRQVFFTTTGFAHGFWAMSQPGLLAWLLKLRMDDNAAAFIDDYEMRNNPEYRWPAAASAFRGIRRLLPNRYLDIGTAKERRFWPKSPLRETVLEEGLEQAAGMLEGLMDAAYRRFDLVHGITAGYDSRTVLAAARKHRERVQAVTVRQGRMPDDHRDIVVPARLLDKLGISHTVIKSLPTMSSEFSKTFKENIFFAHDHYGPDAEAILAHFSRQKVAVTGSGAEVAKTYFREMVGANKSRITGEDLSRGYVMGNNEFAVRHFSEWLQETGELYNVPVLDLFTWEQTGGSWLAAVQMEFDFAWRDIFTPFNCRALLVCLLSIDECYRSGPDYRAFRALIEMMWPELLDEPINPQVESENPQFARSWWRSTKRIVKRHIVGKT